MRAGPSAGRYGGVNPFTVPPFDRRRSLAMAATPNGTRLSADDALARLIEGNQRFLRGEARSAAFRREKLTDLARAQSPYATILGCSDSRVPPEWIFDTGLGELFVIRVAGNVYSPEIAGTLQYAGSYLETPLFVVLGHEGCGAITAALATKHAGEQFRSRVQLLLTTIVPGLPEIDPTLSSEEQASLAVEGNVRWTVRQIVDTPEVQARLAQGRSKIVGAVYEIETGRVRFLSPSART
jgi:carbonic anhydrase